MIFYCDCCHRRIGKQATHYFTEDNRIMLCGRCVLPRSTHHRMYPDCPHKWHDMHDHGSIMFATRAGVIHLLKQNRTQQ